MRSQRTRTCREDIRAPSSQGAGRKAAPHAQKQVCQQMPEGAGQEEAETKDSICLGLN